MRAVGFSRQRLGKMVLWENSFLLVMGLLVGIGAALVTTLPHWLIGNASIPWGDLAMMFARHRDRWVCWPVFLLHGRSFGCRCWNRCELDGCRRISCCSGYSCSKTPSMQSGFLGLSVTVYNSKSRERTVCC